MDDEVDLGLPVPANNSVSNVTELEKIAHANIVQPSNSTITPSNYRFAGHRERGLIRLAISAMCLRETAGGSRFELHFGNCFKSPDDETPL